MASSSSADRNPLERLAEDFARRYRQGERPSLTEYADRYPQLADEIRELFPALVAMEQLKPASGGVTGPYTVTAPDGRTLERLGDYRLLREVGRGGMGVVYEAEQVSLGRHVALKVLPSAAPLDPRRLQRFEREARAAGRLHHTNIVPVYGVGADQGVHYFVMQLIQGQGLHEVLQELRRLRRPDEPLPSDGDEPEASQVARSLLTGCGSAAGSPQRPTEPEHAPVAPSSATVVLRHSATHALSDVGLAYWKSVARTGVQVAEALAHAHGQGILHRDIKPSNLLLDTHGTVWVTDFGLAKVMSDDDNLTQTGDFVGTLRYMAPERFRGQSDARSDVYSLGLTLYEMLTLGPAFTAPDRSQLIHQVLHTEPPRPRTLNPQVPRDLETIVLKAIDRDPDRRYPTAQGLAEDLQRFLEDRPVGARRASAGERLWRWCRRNPALAATAALLALALLAAVGVSTAYAVDRARAADQLGQAHSALGEEKRQKDDEALKFRRQTVMLAAEKAQAFLDQGDPNRALLWLARALEDTPADDADLQFYLRTNLGGIRPERFEVVGHESAPTRPSRVVAYSADGQRQLVYDYNKPLRVLDGADGKAVGPPLPLSERPYLAEFTPDGATLLVVVNAWQKSRSAEMLMWDVKEGKDRFPPVSCSSTIHCLAQYADGRRFATAHEDGAVQFWDLSTGRPDGRPCTPGKPSDATSRPQLLAITPDGQTAILRYSYDVFLCDAAARKVRGQPLRPGGLLGGMAVSPDGRLLATTSDLRHVRLWDILTGQEVGSPLLHRFAVRSVAFSPDGRTLLSGGGTYAGKNKTGEARLWNVADGRPVGELMEPRGHVSAVGFSPDGALAFTAHPSSDGVLVTDVWEANSGRPVRSTLAGAARLVQSHTGVPGISSVIAAHILAQDVGEAGPLPRLLPHIDPVISVVFSPDGRRVVTGTDRSGIGGIRVGQQWEVATGEPVGPRMPHGDGVRVVAYSPDGQTVLTGGGGYDGTAKLWDADTGRLRAKLNYSFGSEIRVVAFSADSRTVLVAGFAKNDDQTVRIFDTTTGQPAGKSLTHGRSVTALALSADARLVLSGGTEPEAILWEVATGSRRGEPLRHDGPVTAVAFSPDNTRILTASEDRTVRLWDLATGALLHTLRHEASVIAAEFSPDGARVLTGSSDRTARLWDARTGQPVGLTWEHPDRVMCSAFSRDGRIVVTGCADRNVRIWAADTGKLIGPPLPHPQPVKAVALSPDGRCVLTACEDLAARLWDVPAPVAGEARHVRLWVETQTGQTMDDSGAVRALSEEAARQRMEELARLGDGPPRTVDADARRQTRHERLALHHQYQEQWTSAAWHWSRLLETQPKHAFAHLQRARAHYLLGATDAAAADYAMAFSLGPRDRLLNLALSYVDECEAYRGGSEDNDKSVKERKYRTAVWHLDRMIAALPDEWSLYDRRAQAFQRQGDADKVEADYQRALPLGPDALFFVRWGYYHAQRGQYDVAAADYARAVERPMPHLPTMFDFTNEVGLLWPRQALLRLHVGDHAGYRKAVAEVQRIFTARRAATLNVRAWSAVIGPDSVEDPMAIVSLAQEAVSDQRPRSHAGATEMAGYLNTLGATLYRAGRFEEAVRCLEEGVRLRGGTAVPEDDFFLALAHQRLGRQAIARKCLDRAIEGMARVKPDGKSPWGWTQHVEGQLFRREFETLEARDAEARTALDEAVKASPLESAPLLARGRFLANRGRWAEATADFDAAVRAHPDDPQVWLARGRCFDQAGQDAPAARDVTRAAELRPRDAAWLRQCALAHQQARRWGDAAIAYQRAVEQNPTDLDLWQDCANAHAVAGQWAGAVAAFARVVQEKPDDAPSHSLHALALLGAGDRDGYRAACARLLTQFGETPEVPVALAVLSACLALPDAVADLASLHRLAQKAGAPYRGDYPPQLPGGYFRAGSLDEAARKLEIQARVDSLDGVGWLLYALTEAKRDRPNEARKHLERALKWIDAAEKRAAGQEPLATPTWASWRTKLIAGRLRHEAEALIDLKQP